MPGSGTWQGVGKVLRYQGFRMLPGVGSPKMMSIVLPRGVPAYAKSRKSGARRAFWRFRGHRGKTRRADSPRGLAQRALQTHRGGDFASPQPNHKGKSRVIGERRRVLVPHALSWGSNSPHIRRSVHDQFRRHPPQRRLPILGRDAHRPFRRPRMAGDAPDGMELDARRRLVDHQGQDDARRPAAHRGCGARRSD